MKNWRGFGFGGFGWLRFSRRGFLEVGEAGFDCGVGDAECGFHFADAAFGEDEDTEEMEVIFAKSGEFVRGEDAGDKKFAGVAVEGGGDQGTFAGGVADHSLGFMAIKYIRLINLSTEYSIFPISILKKS